jgi:hypothetical protein
VNRAGAIPGSLRAVDSHLFDRMNADITPDDPHRYLKAISETPAPFQTVASSRGAVVELLLREDGLLDGSSVACDLNFQDSDNTVLFMGDSSSATPIWLLAHLDTMTYLTLPG